ncbi:MAG: hypothetical protein RJA98_2795, partial [Pseudomonadota bacterium]
MATASLLNTPAPLKASATQAVPPELTQALLASDVPLVLLPVRLETRFFEAGPGQIELRIRVFPDPLHIEGHEAPLTQDEQHWGLHFWEQVWRAGPDDIAQRRAWQQLADRFDARRATWIAHVLRPLNPQDRPTSAVPEGTALNPPPTPAADLVVRPDAAQSDWQLAPQVRLMPRRWIAIARAAGRLVGSAFSTSVAEPLAAGPAPQHAHLPADDQLANDPGMAWITDFAAAETSGMALRMLLPAATAQAGLDALLVFGVNDALDASASARALENLLAAQHHTRGLAFLRPGTPTNNSEDQPSGYNSQDEQHTRSGDGVLNAPDLEPGDGSAADTVVRALGLDADTALPLLRSANDAAAQDTDHARHMGTALWSATWGHYLHNLIGFDGSGLTPEHVSWARQHFIHHVRAFGPLPTLRVGRQPYGLLPVLALSDWEPNPGEAPDRARERWLQQWLLTLRDQLWQGRLVDTPHIGRSSDPNQDLLQVLSSDGVSASYRVRHVLGPQYLWHLRQFLGNDLSSNGWLAAQSTLTTSVLQQLGQAWRPRLVGAAYDEATRDLHAPLIQAPAAEPGQRAQDYIGALLASPPLPANADTAPPPLPAKAPLLQALLWQATQREYGDAAARAISASGGLPLSSLLPDAELIHFNAATAVNSWRQQLTTPSPATGGQPPGVALPQLSDFSGPAFSALGEFRRALAHLQHLDADTLRLQLAGTLDLCTHRLDAWITAFATQRLDEMRQTRPHGVRLGAYGWVENLKPAAPSALRPAPPGETGTVQLLPADPGYIHAPSLAQAQTAALLRNAHLSHANSDATRLLSVDLSSRRVRLAAKLLDGVRAGQPLPALLGYLFERSLHEHGQDEFISRWRELAPLRNKPLDGATRGGEASEFVPASRVADGLQLRQQWSAYVANPSNASTASPYAVCAASFRELDDAVDALSDAVLAESAHQMTRGNTARAASTLQAISGGEAPPPELEFARTPRTGIGL